MNVYVLYLPHKNVCGTMCRMINVEVQRHGNENVGGLLRRFTRKMQSSGVIKRVRGLRYHKRNASQAKQKKDALIRIERTEKYIQLFKEGRVVPTKRRR